MEKDKKEIVFHNNMNNLILGGLNPKMNDIFFSFIYKFKELEKDCIKITFAELKKLSNSDRTNKYFVKNLKELSVKLKQITTIQETTDKIEIFSPIRKITIDLKESNVIVEIDEDFKKLLYNLENNYTIADLKELVSLKSSYSKNLYRFLKQWDSIKKLTNYLLRN